MQALRASMLNAAETPPPGRLDPGRLQLLAFAGREDLIEARLSELGYGGPQICETSAGGVDVFDGLVERARDTRIVVVNEDHARPSHRAFIAELALALRQEGYTLYAAEAFRARAAPSPEAIGAEDGHYLAEPEFARLVRTVATAGYSLHAYEQAPNPARALTDERAQVEAREADQAASLNEILEAAGSGARMLVHAGHAHASERPLPFTDGRPLAWMAALLEGVTGINPLTIDLTTCRSDRGGPHLVTGDPGGRFAPRTDIALAFPAPRFDHGRPDWRHDRGDRRISLPRDWVETDAGLIFEVRPAEDSDALTPWDRYLLLPGEAPPVLFAPQGDVRVDAFDQEGRVYSLLLDRT